MPISFHCECCKQKIKAPDAAGGKWGSCPYCKHRCYTPLPKSEDEPELKLAPIDEGEETKIGMMMNQTYALTRELLHEKDTPAEPAGIGGDKAVDEKAVIKMCILYLRQMADAELDGAEKSIAKMKIYKRTALRVLASMARADKPEPELSDIPDKILQGLIHDAEAKLSS